jgi:hypothetical protein
MKTLVPFLALTVLLIFSANAQTITTAGSGNWRSTTPNAPWPGGIVPTSSNNVIIADGHTVYLDSSLTFTVANLTIGQGVHPGVLTYAANVTAANSLTITGNLTISDSGQFTYGSIPSVLPNVYLGGNFQIGTGAVLNLASGSSKGIKLNFNSSATGVDQTVTSTGTHAYDNFKFGYIFVNRPNATDRVLCNTTMWTKAGPITLLKGIWEQNAGKLNDTSASASNENMGSTNGTLKITGSGSYACTSSLQDSAGIGRGGSMAAIYINTTGTFSTGTKKGSATFQNMNSLTIVAGTVNIYSRYIDYSVTTISGGTVNIDPQSGAGAVAVAGTNNAFAVDSGATFNMSGGTINIVNPLSTTGAGLEMNLSKYGVYNITGGTISFGNGVASSAGSADGFQVSAPTAPLWNVIVNNPSGTNRQVTLTDGTGPTDLVVKNNLAVTAGTLNANVGTGSNISIGGAFSNSGAFNGGSASTYTYNGTSAQTTGALPVTVPNLTIDNSNGVTLSRATTINGVLRLAAGVFDNTIPFTLGPSGSVVMAGGSLKVPTSVEENSTNAVPLTFFLSQNYPNPFNPSTTFTYQIAKEGFVSVKIFDILGQEATTLVNEAKQAGTYSATWNAAGFVSGIYFCRMQSGSFTEIKKITLMK